MCVQDKGNVLLLSVGSIQGNLHGLLCEAQPVRAEEMHLHLIVENWERRNREFTEGLLYTCLIPLLKVKHQRSPYVTVISVFM